MTSSLISRENKADISCGSAVNSEIFGRILFSQIALKDVFATLKISDREHSGSVVECLTRDRRVTGLRLTGVTVLCL